MCGFVGISNLKESISNNYNILKGMNNVLSNRGPDEEGYFISNNVNLAHKRLVILDKLGGRSTYEYYYK